MTMKPSSTCPGCNGRRVYASKEISAGGGHAPDYLPGLGQNWWSGAAKLTVVVCADCGLIRSFAGEDALRKLPDSKHWRKL